MLVRLTAAIVALAGTAVLAAEPPKGDAPSVLSGKVVPVVKRNAKPTDPKGVALDTGKELLPLAESDVSRLFFLDTALHNRPLELTVKARPGSAELEVTQVRTVVDGKRHEVFYFCFNCQVRAEEPGACKCCGGDTVLVEKPIPAK